MNREGHTPTSIVQCFRPQLVESGGQTYWEVRFSYRAFVGGSTHVDGWASAFIQKKSVKFVQ